MEQHCQLSCHGHYRSFLGIFPSSLRKLQPPSPQITVFSKRPQNVVRPLHHHRSQIPVSLLADFLCGSLFPEFLRPGRNPRKQPTSRLFGNHTGPRSSGHRSARSAFPHPSPAGARTLPGFFLGDFLHPFVVLLDALVQRFDLSQERRQEHRVTPRSLPQPASRLLDVCHTWAVVRHKTSPIRVRHLPGPCAH